MCADASARGPAHVPPSPHCGPPRHGPRRPASVHTGITADMIAQYGMPRDQALAALRACLPRNAVVVGQNISTDIKWLQLREGQDYASLVDLVGLFRAWNEKYSSYTYFGLEHETSMLLGIDDAGQAHNAVTDAIKVRALCPHAPREERGGAPTRMPVDSRALARLPRAAAPSARPKLVLCGRVSRSHRSTQLC